MDTKMEFRLFLICSICFFCWGCPHKECIGTDKLYQFAIEIIHVDQIKVGDTVWVKSEIDCRKMLNLNTSTLDEFCNSIFTGTINQSLVVDSIPQHSTGATDKFEIINIQGSVYNNRDIPSPDRVNQLKFESTGDKYTLHFGLICMQEGKFVLGFPGGISIEKDYCERAKLIFIVKNENKNLWILEELIAPQIVEEHVRNRTYCFEVK
jgi:hypothetical protein